LDKAQGEFTADLIFPVLARTQQPNPRPSLFAKNIALKLGNRNILDNRKVSVEERTPLACSFWLFRSCKI
jgi:hypothetical protein